MRFRNRADEVPGERVELAARRAEGAVGAQQAAGDEGCVCVCVCMGQYEVLVEATSNHEAVVVDFGDECIGCRIRASRIGDDMFEELDALDRIRNMCGLLQIKHDQIAIRVVFMPDKRVPEGRGSGEDEAGRERRVRIQGLPGRADDVAAALGSVGGYGGEEPSRLCL